MSTLNYVYQHFSLPQYSEDFVLKSIINIRNDHLNFKIHSYYCNRGIAVLRSNQTECLCPPAYYGRWCQFFSDRISVIVHMNHSTLPKSLENITLKVQANLLFNNRKIDYHQFHLIRQFESVTIIKHRFYFLYSRSSKMIEQKRQPYYNRTDVNTNHPYSVHFDVFTLHKNGSVEELGSWDYPIYFDYLPAFRLAVILRFPSWFDSSSLNPCWYNRCNKNSTCLPILNENNRSYCSCRSGFYGRNCNMYESRCETHWSMNALCRADADDLKMTNKEIHCICPLGHFGARCNLKYDECDQNSCFNNGTCHLTYDPSSEKPYVCKCTERFDGNRCQNSKPFVRASAVQLYYFDGVVELKIKHQQVFHRLPSMINYYYSDMIVAPSLGILKTYEDFSNPKYFVLYALYQRMINITSSPQLCPHALSLLFDSKFQIIDHSVHI